MEYKYEMLIERNFYQNPSVYLITKVTVIGEYNRNRLEDAILEMKRVHPIINYVLEEGDEGKVNFVRKKEAKLTTKFFEKKNEKDWLRIANEEELIPLEFDNEPPLRFLVVFAKEDFDIVILSHHLLGDGKSIQYLMHDLLEAYCNNARDLQVQDTRMIRSIQDMPGESELPPEVVELIQDINQEWSMMRPQFTKEEYRKLFTDYHKMFGLGLIVEPVDKEKYPYIITQCKKYGVTVNSALVTAFLAASEVKGEEDVTVAVNLRDQLTFETNRCIANYSAAITPLLEYHEEETFWENVVRVHNLIRKDLDQPSKVFAILQVFSQIDSSVFDSMYYLVNGTYKGKILPNVSKVIGFSNNQGGFDFSNLGVVDIPHEMGEYTIKDYVFSADPPMVHDFKIGVATLNEQLNIAVCFKKNKISEDAIRIYTEKAINILCS